MTTATITERNQISALGVSAGVVCAPWLSFAVPERTSAQDPITGEPDSELARIRAALDTVSAELLRRAESVDGVSADILTTSAAMARDRAIVGAAQKNLESGLPTAHSVTVAFDGFCAKLDAVGGYMAERATDLRDLAQRVVAVLRGEPMPGIPNPGYPYILVARDLAPADTATLGDTDVVGLLTAEGGPTSHTAILAKSLGIPAVVNCADTDRLVSGAVLILDGSSGTVTIDPSPEQCSEVAREASARAARAATASGPGRTRDGFAVRLAANIGTVADAERVGAADCEGVGLFRTEFSYLGRHDAPSVAEQTATYRAVFEHFAGRAVVVRTLDSGSDKPLPFLDLGVEENPALGIRGLRVANLYPDTLVTQLDALVAAADATGADLRVMAPMVATADEAAGFAELARSRGVGKVGAMIEVPAAALRARDLLEHLDFLSIGTNDLSQYTCAVDRMTGSLAHLLDPWQPAVLDLIAMVGQAGAVAGKPVGVCGESASDPLLAPVLVGLGVSSLSMSVAAIGAVRAELSALDLEVCLQMASAARNARTPVDGRAAVASIRNSS
ncbi:phosphoenolpyruvate--protein phosphotransferase [Rhodococcus globerulus]|uniref:phosphoenolpyruvate--protein phosphotransferase n=1 Tax=Rhodococcus globerulus TaxID=33008 RepID=UPI0039ECF1EE